MHGENLKLILYEYILFFDRRPDTEGAMWPLLVSLHFDKGRIEKYSLLLSDTLYSN